MIETLEACDNFAPLRNGLRRVAGDRGEWAGIPMPLEGRSLIIEPNFPNAEILSKMGKSETEEEVGDAKIINSFWSRRKQCEIIIWEENGKREWGIIPGVHHLDQDIATLHAATAWGIEQEAAAVRLLGTLLRHHSFKDYLLTGMFMEHSERSGVSYIFRRLKPTVALSTRTEHTRILAALCLHPIGYYDGSWAGAMCPTDDVIAHLMLMRGDEPMFWRRANQHPPHRPEAGL